jgi:hypothetical protein
VPLEQNVSLILFKLCSWEGIIIKVLLRESKIICLYGRCSFCGGFEETKTSWCKEKWRNNLIGRNSSALIHILCGRAPSCTQLRKCLKYVHFLLFTRIGVRIFRLMVDSANLQRHCDFNGTLKCSFYQNYAAHRDYENVTWPIQTCIRNH